MCDNLRAARCFPLPRDD